MMTRRESALALLVMGVGGWALHLAMQPRRQKQERQSCYTNLRQIGRGLELYAEDNDETYPRAWFGHDAGSSDAHTNYKWMDAIFPYVKREALFTCPSDNANQPYHFRSGEAYGSYVINNAYFFPGDAQTPPAGVSENKVAQPSSTVLLVDGAGSFQAAWPDARHTPALIGDNPFQLDSIRGRHGAGIYQTALALGCDFSCSTGLHSIMSETNVIKGQKVYTAFTIEGDEN